MKLFHIHKWEPIAVQNLTIEDRGYDTREFVTRILYRCECEKLKSRDINGSWTLEQIKGES